jgi:hypothetical protein
LHITQHGLLPVTPPRTLPPLWAAILVVALSPVTARIWVSGALSRYRGLPVAGCADLVHALDAVAGGTGMGPGGVLIIRHGAPAPGAAQRLGGLTSSSLL